MAGYNSYSYLFMVNDEYYNITVNYSNSHDMTEQITNEINKTLPINLIKKDIKRLNEVKSKLNELNFNELKFIAK